MFVQGLIHITELAWSRVSNPESVVQPGDHIKCKVVKADAQTGKIGLSLKVRCSVLDTLSWHPYQRLKAYRITQKS